MIKLANDERRYHRAIRGREVANGRADGGKRLGAAKEKSRLGG